MESLSLIKVAESIMRKNLRLFERPYPRVPLHQDSIKHVKKGHPWILSDKFTAKFPKHNLFLIGTSPSTKEECVLFIHDWRHPKIKGRVWSHQAPYVEKVKNFQEELGSRLEAALIRREELKLKQERDNYYWAFGEADLLPGLFIQFLGNIIHIQTYCSFWFPLEFVIIGQVSRLLKNYFPDRDFEILLQERFPGCKPAVKRMTNFKDIKETVSITEFGIKYEIFPFKGLDFGLYTDAASIRKKLSPLMDQSKSLLNLFSYTGAFSLLGLSKGLDVFSVDLSTKYMDRLKNNIKLNNFSSHHTSMVMSAEQALKKLKRDEKEFDFIICDPPSSSSDGRKITRP